MDNSPIVECIIATMQDLEDIKTKIIPILKEAGIKRSSLFGSYVRGDATSTSDIDILVDYPDGLSLFDVVDIQTKLEAALGMKVDLVSFDRIKPRIKQSILSSQVPVL